MKTIGWHGTRIAAPLLAALMALGCGAGDAAATPRPGDSPIDAPLPDRAAPTSAPIGDALDAPATATPLIPSAVQGRWTPDSKALQAAGALTLSARTLTWPPCGATPRAATAEQRGTTVLLALPGQTACRLNGEPVTHLRLQPAAANACELELSVYESAAQLARHERLAWGVYTRAGCAAGRDR